MKLVGGINLNSSCPMTGLGWCLWKVLSEPRILKLDSELTINGIYNHLGSSKEKGPK